MTINKRIDFWKTKIEVAREFDWIREISFEDKWSNFKSKNYKDCLIEPCYLGKKYKYHDKKSKQYYKKAVELLNNDKFIERVLDLAKDCGLDKRIYGTPPERAILSVQNAINRDKEKKEKLQCVLDRYKTNKNRTLECYYDPEYHEQLNSAWYSMLHLISLQYIKKYSQQIKKEEKEALADKRFTNNIPFTKYENKLKNLLNSFGLSPIWKNSIDLLLITSWFFVPQNYCPVIVEKKNNEVSLLIPVHSDTQRDDIVHNWKKISKLQEQIYGKKKRITTSRRNEFYFNLSSEVNKGNPIEEVVDFDIEKIPFEMNSEKKALKSLKKGISRTNKLFNNSKPIILNTPEYLELLEEISGRKEISYLF